MFKSNKVAQVNESLIGSTGISASDVKIDSVSDTKRNIHHVIPKYTKYTKYHKNTGNNLYLITPTQNATNVDFTRFIENANTVDISNLNIIQKVCNLGLAQQFFDAYSSTKSIDDTLRLSRIYCCYNAEVFKPITAYDGIYFDKYEVSNLGRIRSVKSGLILKQHIKHGYLYVYLCANGQHKGIRVNRLVLMTFNNESFDNMDATHANTIRTDNRIINLQWKTHSDNMKNPITQKKHKDTINSKAKAESKAAASTSE